jgi:hypothetical protein
MVLMGDVLAVVATLAGVCLSAWVLLIGSSLIFSRRAAAAESLLEHSPWRSLIIGLAVGTLGGIVSIALTAQPSGVLKLVGMAGYLIILSLGVLGGCGLAQLVARRIHPLDPSLSPLKSLSRGAAILVVPSLLPLLGWFVFAPVVLAISIGAGLQAILSRSGAAPIVSPAATATP